jgi:hypothetical protein
MESQRIKKSAKEWVESLPPEAEIQNELEKNCSEARLLRELLSLSRKRDKLRDASSDNRREVRR